MESRGIQNYPKRFQSAEGCYSQRAIQTRGLKLKTASKQAVGLAVPSDQVRALTLYMPCTLLTLTLTLSDNSHRTVTLPVALTQMWPCL